MTREEIARNKHKSGSNCATAVYTTFSDLVDGAAPLPRSEGGKCGAVLAAEKVLTQLGKDTDSFGQTFMEQFGSLKCVELRKGKYPCNDLVGTAAKMVEEAVQ